MGRFVSDYRAFERSLLATYAAGSRAGLSAVEAHDVLDIGGLGGHRVLAAIAEANSGVGAAISNTAMGHRHMEAVGKGLGLDVTAWGDGQPKPEQRPGFFTQARSDAEHAA